MNVHEQIVQVRAEIAALLRLYKDAFLLDDWSRIDDIRLALNDARDQLRRLRAAR